MRFAPNFESIYFLPGAEAAMIDIDAILTELRGAIVSEYQGLIVKLPLIECTMFQKNPNKRLLSGWLSI